MAAIASPHFSYQASDLKGIHTILIASDRVQLLSKKEAERYGDRGYGDYGTNCPLIDLAKKIVIQFASFEKWAVKLVYKDKTKEIRGGAGGWDAKHIVTRRDLERVNIFQLAR